MGESGSKKSKQEVGASIPEEGESLTSGEIALGAAPKEPKGIGSVFLQRLRQHICFFHH